MRGEIKMSTIKQPVVWCSDPNSTNKKPTAFALQGIQFEGMITEQHVLALREIINAAAEGRLLLPSNGAIVLLDCGIDANSIIGSGQQQQHTQNPATETKLLNTNNDPLSMIATVTSAVHTAEPLNVPANEQIKTTVPIYVDTSDANETIERDPGHKRKHSNQATNSDTVQLEPKYSEFDMPELSKYDFIYEFLCCAKCIKNETQKSNSIGAKESGQRKVISCDHNHGFMFNIEKNQCHLSSSSNRSNNFTVPICATINTKLRKHNLFANQSSKHVHCPVLNNVDVHENNRKECESFDKNDICTVDSHARNDNETVMKQTVPIENEMQTCHLSINNDIHESNGNIPSRPSSSKNSSRKTSLDSLCTIGSMDSGFIEMQNKLELSTKEANQSACAIDFNTRSTTPTIGNLMPTITVTPDCEITENESTCINQTEHLNKDNVLLKECSTQSRNRRKSYEEFKAIYHNRMTLESGLPFVDEHEHTLFVSNKKEKIKARRKSYEEFKALVRECGGDDVNELKRKKSKKHSKSGSKTLSTMDENAMAYLNARSDEKQSQDVVTSSEYVTSTTTQCDVLASSVPNTSTNTPLTPKTKNDIYKTNFKIYDKLISYGTIYDIMQKKSDIYKAYRKYDAYMTYGTIYEILQLKSDDNEFFRRARATSEKCFKKRINGNNSSDSNEQTTATDGTISNTNKDDKNRSLNFGAIYNIIQRKHRQSKKSNSLPNGVIGAIEMAKISDAGIRANRKFRASDGCIYDLIQSKQSDLDKSITKSTSGHCTAQPNIINNRFLVEKVNENKLSHTKSNDSNKTTCPSSDNETRGNTYCELATDTISSSISSPFLSKWNNPRLSKVKKSNRMRRFSHILSYTHRAQSDTNTVANVTSASEQKLQTCTEASLPQTIDKHSTDGKEETISSESASNTLNKDLKLEQQISNHRKEVRVRKLNKLRKMSSPLPLPQCCDQPPKIAPRKQSVPPPPVPPPSFHWLTQSHNLKSNDAFAGNQNEHAKILNEIHAAKHVTCNDSNNNNKNNNSNSNSKHENNNNNNWANEQQQQYSHNDSDSVKSKKVTSDAKVSKSKQKHSIKLNLHESKPIVKRSTANNEKKAKSRRLSEFTRGEFLNEKP